MIVQLALEVGARVLVSQLVGEVLAKWGLGANGKLDKKLASLLELANSARRSTRNDAERNFIDKLFIGLEEISKLSEATNDQSRNIFKNSSYERLLQVALDTSLGQAKTVQGMKVRTLRAVAYMGLAAIYVKLGEQETTFFAEAIDRAKDLDEDVYELFIGKDLANEVAKFVDDLPPSELGEDPIELPRTLDDILTEARQSRRFRQLNLALDQVKTRLNVMDGKLVFIGFFLSILTIYLIVIAIPHVRLLLERRVNAKLDCPVTKSSPSVRVANTNWIVEGIKFDDGSDLLVADRSIDRPCVIRVGSAKLIRDTDIYIGYDPIATHEPAAQPTGKKLVAGSIVTIDGDLSGQPIIIHGRKAYKVWAPILHP